MALRTPESVHQDLVNAVDQLNQILATYDKRIANYEERLDQLEKKRTPAKGRTNDS